MTVLRSHGGSCCGMRHIWGFHDRETKAELQRHLADTKQHPTQGMLVEVVLTNAQCRRNPNHPKWLQELGFKLVSRFKNPNSGNICNVFHYNKAPRSLTTRLPFPIVQAD